MSLIRECPSYRQHGKATTPNLEVPNYPNKGIYIFNFPTAICCGCPEGETTIHWGQKSQIYSSPNKRQWRSIRPSFTFKRPHSIQMPKSKSFPKESSRSEERRLGK